MRPPSGRHSSILPGLGSAMSMQCGCARYFLTESGSGTSIGMVGMRSSDRLAVFAHRPAHDVHRVGAQLDMALAVDVDEAVGERDDASVPVLDDECPLFAVALLPF